MKLIFSLTSGEREGGQFFNRLYLHLDRKFTHSLSISSLSLPPSLSFSLSLSLTHTQSHTMPWFGFELFSKGPCVQRLGPQPWYYWKTVEPLEGGATRKGLLKEISGTAVSP
jgi:hypothetical protein